MYVYGEPGHDKLLLCASPYVIYPDAENCTWSTDTGRGSSWEDPVIDLDPFVLDAKNHLVHRGNVEDILAGKKTPSESSVALKMEGENWKYSGEMCYIAAKNIRKAPIAITISAQGNNVGGATGK